MKSFKFLLVLAMGFCIAACGDKEDTGHDDHDHDEHAEESE